MDHGCCNEKELTVLDLSAMKELTVFETATNCFKNVGIFRAIGLDKLERVAIGSCCFMPLPMEEESCCSNSSMEEESCCSNSSMEEEAYSFYVKDCGVLKELKIGVFSFTDYSVCEIGNVPMLEVIEMGDTRVFSAVFSHADLVLKSCEGRLA